MISGRMHLPPDITPVSYTHLDVYKRQADSSVFVLDAVDCVDTLENILNRIVYRVL